MPIRSIIFVSLLATGLFGLASRLGTAQSPAAPPGTTSWTIAGALSETCTCKVPCTCNFGQGPSPHSYCYAFFSYHIRSGKYGTVSLDGLHFGAADLATKRTYFIEDKANPEQREALKAIIARVIEKEPVANLANTIRDIAPDLRFAAVKQDYGDRKNLLEVGGIGSFAADYIMGLDKTHPVVVHNNTTWRIVDTIKAKTTLFKVRVGRDNINVRDTNSNQGDFAYTDQTDFGSKGAWSCGASMSETRPSKPGDPMCGAGNQ
ncbi:MAG: DUF1326 domain-containing protein [Pyrinomonadaceae bacterium]